MGDNENIKEKKNPEVLLRCGKTIEMSPRGWSMYPLIVPGRDKVIISPTSGRQLKKLDIALFRREGSILVIHRIAAVRKKKDGSRVYFFVGDNQKELEGPVKEESICGVVTGLVRKGRRMSVGGLLYRASVSAWMFLRPVRPQISHFIAGIKKLGK
jgi:hypothetical protein